MVSKAGIDAANARNMKIGKANILKAIGAVKSGSTASLTLIGEKLKRDLYAELSKPGSGRIYGSHRASAPGEPPAPDTNALRNSLFARMSHTGELELGSEMGYGGHLELGTVNIEPRPWLRTTIARDGRLEIRSGVQAGVRTAVLAARASMPPAGL